MNKKIYKYPLETRDVISVDIPIGSEILCIQNQKEVPCLWVLVDPNQRISEKRFFEIFATGDNIDYDIGKTREYIGTYQLSYGNLVFHVFEYTGLF